MDILYYHRHLLPVGGGLLKNNREGLPTPVLINKANATCSIQELFLSNFSDRQSQTNAFNDLEGGGVGKICEGVFSALVIICINLQNYLKMVCRRQKLGKNI